VACNLALSLKHYLPYDDALDVFAVHGVGGIVGNILTGVFAQKAYSGGTIEGGWLDGHWMQVVHQLVDTAAGLSWSFIVTFIILFIMNKIPGLSLRVDLDVERAGLDEAELGFSCYQYHEDVKSSSTSLGKSNNAFGSVEDHKNNRFGNPVQVYPMEQSRL